ncbi:serine protease [Streptomyces sp. NBC_00201]|uniref:trypsin-like peptidase domain-containing protein n=1 Tax=Streptomyces sp. NBC_00201 TaxID=2975679 RepID=UPI0022540C3D|nr:serine protease [Streptomyces sp. NBC_00201]
MAGRGPRTGGGHRQGDGARTGHSGDAGRPPVRDDALVRIHDLAGRPRGTGFVADHHGTVITSHEAVDGLPRLVLHAAGDRTCLVTADAVTALPDLDLALVRTEGLGVDPLPVTVRDRVETGTYVRIAAGCWREARVLGAASVTYAATERFHLLDGALELAIGTAGRDALRLGGGAAGGPVLDAGTGAVVGVLGTALHSGRRDAGFAVPLLPAPSGPLADLLARNAATVPAYGPDLNLAGVLELTATSVGQDGPPGTLAGYVGRADASVEPVERAATVREFTSFARSRATVLGLVGAPGSGRTTELASLAARRNRESEPAPTLWLRGADLEDDDTSVADAARRALTRAARIVTASGTTTVADLDDITPERLAQVAFAADRPLLLLLDGPEEMPAVLAHRLRKWTQGTASWLRESGARLVVACREEYWEGAGAEFPAELLFGGSAVSARPAFEDEAVQPEAGVRGRGRGLGEGTARGGGGGCSDQRLRPRPCVRLGDLQDDEARKARARYRIPEGTLTDPDTRHPLTLRLLSEVLAALQDAPHARVDRDDVFSAYLDLMCLRVAVRLAAENGLRGTAVRRLAAKVSGQIHEAARRSLGPGQGELDRETFEAVFPWGQAPARLGGGSGWASAILTEGLLIPAGTGYRFAHEELADWIQGMHLDLDEALRALVHRHGTPDAARPLSVPHHRIGPVVQALLLVARQHGTPQLAARLEELAHALERDPHSWWAARLLTETLLRVPDATPYLTVLRQLAARLAAVRGLDRSDARGEERPDLWGQGRSDARGQDRPEPWGQSCLHPQEQEQERPDPQEQDRPDPWGQLGPDPWGQEGPDPWGQERPEARRQRRPELWGQGCLDPRGQERPDLREQDCLDPRGQDRPDLREQDCLDPRGQDRPDLREQDCLDPRGQDRPDLREQDCLDPRGQDRPDLREQDCLDPRGQDRPDLREQDCLDPREQDRPDLREQDCLDPWGQDRPDSRESAAAAPAVADAFAPRFWTALAIPRTECFELLRVLLLADGPQDIAPRFLDAASGLLAADATAVQPLLTRWFDDDRPLPATPHATVAKAAQALLHTHRHLALDDLTEVLVECAHLRADELLAVLAEDEPSAVCRAVDRWAHDERPARRVAAVAYGLRAMPHVRTEADRDLLRYAALALLARPADSSLHGGALALLVRDPRTRARHLPQALRHFAAADPHFPPGALVPALATHPEPVLDAFRDRLRRPDAGQALRTLADVTTPSLARRVAALVHEAVERRPETAVDVAVYVDRRLDQGPSARTVLFPLVTGLLDGGPEEVRAALATVLAAPGTPASRLQRRELLDFLLAHEQAPAVLDALLHAAGRCGGDDVRDLVHRTGLLLVRTPDGAARFDRALVDLGRQVPGFAARMAGWLTDTPQAWAAVVGPSTRRMIENLSGVRVPV